MLMPQFLFTFETEATISIFYIFKPKFCEDFIVLLRVIEILLELCHTFCKAHCLLLFINFRLNNFY